MGSVNMDEINSAHSIWFFYFHFISISLVLQSKMVQQCSFILDTHCPNFIQKKFEVLLWDSQT